MHNKSSQNLSPSRLIANILLAKLTLWECTQVCTAEEPEGVQAGVLRG